MQSYIFFHLLLLCHPPLTFYIIHMKKVAFFMRCWISSIHISFVVMLSIDTMLFCEQFFSFLQSHFAVRYIVSFSFRWIYFRFSGITLSSVNLVEFHSDMVIFSCSDYTWCDWITVYSVHVECRRAWKWKCIHTKCWINLIQAQFKYALTSIVDNCTPYTVYSVQCVQRKFTETKTIPLILQTLSSFVCSDKIREK